jgi:hypothetical protein
MLLKELPKFLKNNVAGISNLARSQALHALLLWELMADHRL